MDNDNIIRLVPEKEDGLPQFNYIVRTTEDEYREVYGFPVFSPQYIMIMREFENGQTVPVYMIPIHLVRSFELDEDDEEEELPF